MTFKFLCVYVRVREKRKNEGNCIVVVVSADARKFLSVLVQLIVPEDGGTDDQSASKSSLKDRTGIAVPTVRFSLLDADETCEVVTALPGMAVQSGEMSRAGISDAENHTLDPFVAREYILVFGESTNWSDSSFLFVSTVLSRGA